MTEKKQAYEPVSFWSQKGLEPTEPDQKEDIFILEYLNKLSFQTVLDIGCGDGRMADLIFKNYTIEKYVGIDLSKDRLLTLEKKSYPAVLHYGDYLKFEFKEKFDLIIASHVLMHIHPFDIENCINKLKKEGTHIIHVDYFPEMGMAFPELEYYNFLHPYPDLWNNDNRLEIHRYSGIVALFHFDNR